ncbi:hypothetical protein JTB14_014722 [Gonioctena quinquepunctata]|nr:hypothetical protein JTB14_014722 [Gonioctena quinquepunctata]
MNDEHHSDHFPILLELPSQILQPTPIGKWCLKKANWNQFHDSLTNLQLTDSVNSSVEYFTNEIMNAATNSIPSSQWKRKRKSVPWWNPELGTSN